MGVVGLRLIINSLFGVYRQIWAYFSLNDILTLGAATVVPSAVFVLTRLVLTSEHQIWRVSLGITLVDLLLAFGGCAVVRLLARLWFERHEIRSEKKLVEGKPSKVLLVGAGMAGIMVVKEAKKQRKRNWKVIGFVDDDRTSQLP